MIRPPYPFTEQIRRFSIVDVPQLNHGLKNDYDAKNKVSPCGCRFQEVFPMKMMNKKLVRTLSCAAVAVCAAAMLSVLS